MRGSLSPSCTAGEQTGQPAGSSPGPMRGESASLAASPEFSAARRHELSPVAGFSKSLDHSTSITSLLSSVNKGDEKGALITARGDKPAAPSALGAAS